MHTSSAFLGTDGADDITHSTTTANKYPVIACKSNAPHPLPPPPFGSHILMMGTVLMPHWGWIGISKSLEPHWGKIGCNKELLNDHNRLADCSDNKIEASFNIGF